MPLPPLPGLLDESLETALRARQRRVWVAANDRFDLRALTAAEEPVERAIVASRLYGAQARDALDTFLQSCEAQDDSGWRFLRLAHSLQVGSHDASLLAEQYIATDWMAVRDAYWHFPVQENIFDRSAAPLTPLFDSTDPAVQALAVELAGRLGDKAAEARLIDKVGAGHQVAGSLLALARMGRVHPRHAPLVQLHLQSPLQHVRSWAIEVAVTLGRGDWLKPWDRLVDLDDAPQDAPMLAWGAWAALDSRAAADAALHATGLPLGLRMRVIALTGHPDALVVAMGWIAEDADPVQPAAADVLHLALGHMPPEAKARPQDAGRKSDALRTRLLDVLRRAHVPIRNDADRAPWTVDAILQTSDQTRAVRIRAGHRLVSGRQTFPECLPDLTHPLREWIFRERALVSGQPVSLSAWDAARRQNLAMALAAAAAEVEDVDPLAAHG
ncbi:hypothetical protein ACFX58_19410 [Sphingomonas sp. NCPPB 2930]